MWMSNGATATIPLAHPVSVSPTLGPLVSARDSGRRLASRLRRRDPAALTELYEAHGSRVFSYLNHVLGDRATAEDICQEVFVEAWRKGARFDPDRGGAGTWLMTIARSRAIDQMRRRVPEPRESLTGGAALADTEDQSASVEVLHERWRMAVHLDRLPDEQAAVLRMRFHGGLSQSEIAEATGIPIGTVKTRMATALNRLRDFMDEEEGS